MESLSPMLSGLRSVALISAAMGVVAVIEAAIPLHPRGPWYRFHLAPNLALTSITFATNLVFNAGLVATLTWIEPRGIGWLPGLALSPVAALAITVLGLDFSFYLAHVAMHAVPALWRFHRVHHSDPALDVTTTIRQHPGEGVIRYLVMYAAAIGLGASPSAFAVYRVWSALNGLLEHANLRMPQRLDTFLSLLVTTPNLHKVHHSRAAAETDTNYGNIFSLFDRLFRTYTPSYRGVNITYGLDDFDDAGVQTTAGLLLMPFWRGPRPAATATAVVAP